jgi:ubiquinone/menaquinone biosynthesis C-methylase UbiE
MSILNLIGKNTDSVRVSWVIDQLKRLPKDTRLLDAGAGELRFKQFCGHLNYVSQDFAQYKGEGDGKGLQTGTWDISRLDIVSDIVNIPEQNESFDAILCTEVLEHIPDALAAIKEFTRLLKPGGSLIITAPFNSLTHFAPYHYCGFSRYWYNYHLEKSGFKIEVLDHNGSWFSYVAQELRRSRQVGKMYSNSFIGYFTRIFVYPIIILLTLLEKFDRGSNELLCFGYMVRAVKN